MTASVTVSQLALMMPKLMRSPNSMEFISAPGRGKSTIVKEFVRRENVRAGYRKWGMSTLFLATQTPPDLIGYIKLDNLTYFDKSKGAEVTIPVSSPAMPKWYTDDETGEPLTNFENFIIFLDEYGQGEPDVKRASAELLLNRQLGPWVGHSGVRVIAASNRSQDRSGVTKSFDFCINRRKEYHIRDDLDGWMAWAEAHNVHPSLMSFAKEYVDVVFASEVPKDQGPWCTPRSLVLCGEDLMALKDDDTDEIPTDEFALATAEGWLGASAAAQLFTHIKLYNALPAYEIIVSDPTGTDVPSGADAKMLLMHKLAHLVKPEHCANAITYMKRLGDEFAVIFARTAVNRQPKLIGVPAFREWMTKNSTLINSVGAMGTPSR